jgi:hypothetical protein
MAAAQVRSHIRAHLIAWVVAAPAAFALAITITTSLGYMDLSRKLSNYGGVSLGENQGDVLYALGSPPMVLGPLEWKEEWNGYSQRVYDTTSSDTKDAIPASKRIEDFDYWGYHSGSGQVTVQFDPKTKAVKSIECYSSEEDIEHSDCPMLAGLHIGDTEEMMRAKLGAPTKRKGDGAARTYRYDDLGLDFTLTKKRIYMIGTFSPKHPTLVRYLRVRFGI